MIQLSIVTITRNDFDGLLRTVRSVDQRLGHCRDSSVVEHVVIDGASDDATPKYLESLSRERSARSIYVSEPDHGIYDAMNKGVARSTGRFVQFLNSGDELDDRADLDAVLSYALQVAGDPDVAGLALAATIRFGSRNLRVAPRNVRSDRPRMPSIHQSMLFKRDLLLSCPFDTEFQICGDYEHFARIHAGGRRFQPVDLPLAVFHAGGVSSQKPLLQYTESTRITDRHYRLPPLQRWGSRVRLALSLAAFQLLWRVNA